MTDDEIIEGIRLLARTEGIFAETAGGVTVATLAKLAARRVIRPDERVVVYITGNGLKTVEALAGAVGPSATIPPTLEAVAEPRSMRDGGSMRADEHDDRHGPHPDPAPTPHRRVPARSRSRRLPCARRSSASNMCTPGSGPRLLDDQGRLRRFVNMFVADEDVRFLRASTPAFPAGSDAVDHSGRRRRLKARRPAPMRRSKVPRRQHHGPNRDRVRRGRPILELGFGGAVARRPPAWFAISTRTMRVLTATDPCSPRRTSPKCRS